VAEVELEGLRVPRLPKPLDRVRMAKEVRVDPFLDARSFRSLPDDLPGPLSVDAEESSLGPDAVVVGVALEPMGEPGGAGDHAGLSPFSHDEEDRPAVLRADHPEGEAQGFRDTEACLVEEEDEEPVPDFAPAGSRVDEPLHFFPREVGDDAEGFRKSVACGDEGVALFHERRQ